jgi:hypothetical protein
VKTEVRLPEFEVCAKAVQEQEGSGKVGDALASFLRQTMNFQKTKIKKNVQENLENVQNVLEFITTSQLCFKVQSCSSNSQDKEPRRVFTFYKTHFSVL